MNMPKRLAATCGVVLFCAALAHAAPPPTVATTPPMGWNSWDCYGTTVTEGEVKANAAYMAAHLKQHGWQYVVVDIQWSQPAAQGFDYQPDANLAMDAYGRLIVCTRRWCCKYCMAWCSNIPVYILYRRFWDKPGHRWLSYAYCPLQRWNYRYYNGCYMRPYKYTVWKIPPLDIMDSSAVRHILIAAFYLP